MLTIKEINAAETRNDQIEDSISNKADTDGLFAIAYAILLLRNQVSDIGEQLYRLADAVDESFCVEVKHANSQTD